ncbi:MAG: phosphodiester glycosidase family protein [Clostridia bacterium]|nr:phosphodiester glycosidase family protein [Clostridia bacterium]
MMDSQRTIILRQELTLFPKIRYVKEVFEDRQDGRQRAFILRICRGADVRIDTVMSPDGQFKLQEPSVSAKACRKENETLIGVVNADFFNMTNGVPQGPVVMNGALIKEDMPDNTYFFGIRRDGTYVIGDKKDFLTNKQTLKTAVGGRHLLVDGENFPEAVLEPKGGCHPRTGVGICENGDLLLVVTEGRNPGKAEGLQLDRFARYLKSLGAEKALNLDGGGSSVMALRTPGQKEIEIVTTPSDGYERVCANGMALFAQGTGDGICRSVYVTPQQEYVAPGTHLKLTAYGLDSLGGPCDLPGDVRFSVPQDSECRISAQGDFIAAETDCDVTVSVSAGEQLLGTALLHVRTPDALQADAAQICAEGEVHELKVSAFLKGRSVLANHTGYRFRLPEDIGRMDETGLFHAKNEACEGDVLVSAKNNGPAVTLHVRVGRLPQKIDVPPCEIETAGCTVSCERPLGFSSRHGQWVYRVEKQQERCELRLEVLPHKKPKAVGMWVHSEEGKAPAFSLTVQNGKEVTAPAAFVHGEPSDSVWTYMEAPVECGDLQEQKLKFIISAESGQTDRFSIDIFRLIYDYLDDDTLLPEIKRISVKKYPRVGEDERIKITAYFGAGDLLPCYVPLDYKRLRILIDGTEYTGIPGHYGVNKGAASLMLHNITVGKGLHRVQVCAQTYGGKQAWADITVDTEQLETIG